MYWNIKVRRPGQKRFAFLTPQNGENHLKIHAVMIDGEERARKLAQEIMDLNKGVVAKVQPV
jgi:hypothetical protein